MIHQAPAMRAHTHDTYDELAACQWEHAAVLGRLRHATTR